MLQLQSEHDASVNKSSRMTILSGLSAWSFKSGKVLPSHVTERSIKKHCKPFCPLGSHPLIHSPLTWSLSYSQWGTYCPQYRYDRARTSGSRLRGSHRLYQGSSHLGTRGLPSMPVSLRRFDRDDRSWPLLLLRLLSGLSKRRQQLDRCA